MKDVHTAGSQAGVLRQNGSIFSILGMDVGLLFLGNGRSLV